MSGHLDRLVTPLVDGQLDHDTRDRAFAHLALCAGCQAEVAVQRALKARLVALDAPTVPPALAERLLRIGAPTIAVREVCGIVPAGQGELIRGEPALPAGQSSSAGDHVLRPELAVSGIYRNRLRPPGFVMPRRAGSRRPPTAATPTRPRRSPLRTVATTRRTRVRTTLIGSAAVMLIALGASAALSDARSPTAPVGPTTVPSVAVAATETGTVGNQWDAPPLATLSVPVVYGR